MALVNIEKFKEIVNVMTEVLPKQTSFLESMYLIQSEQNQLNKQQNVKVLNKLTSLEEESVMINLYTEELVNKMENLTGSIGNLLKEEQEKIHLEKQNNQLEKEKLDLDKDRFAFEQERYQAQQREKTTEILKPEEKKGPGFFERIDSMFDGLENKKTSLSSIFADLLGGLGRFGVLGTLGIGALAVSFREEVLAIIEGTIDGMFGVAVNELKSELNQAGNVARGMAGATGELGKRAAAAVGESKELSKFSKYIGQSLFGFMQTISKRILGPIGSILTGYSVYKETGDLTEAVSAAVGQAGGAAAGAMAGGAIGSLFTPFGTVIGSILGGLVGSFLGEDAGREINDFLEWLASGESLPEQQTELDVTPPPGIGPQSQKATSTQKSREMSPGLAGKKLQQSRPDKIDSSSMMDSMVGKKPQVKFGGPKPGSPAFRDLQEYTPSSKAMSDLLSQRSEETTSTVTVVNSPAVKGGDTFHNNTTQHNYHIENGGPWRSAMSTPRTPGWYMK